MSQLLSIPPEQFDGDEFIERLAGSFAHCQIRNERALQLEKQAGERIAGIRLNVFATLAEIGKVLIRVQESRPGGFEEWFLFHQARLGFKLRHAESCKAASRAVDAHGIERAYAMASERAQSERSTLPTMRVPLTLEGIDDGRALDLFERIRPIYQALAERVGASQVLEHQHEPPQNHAADGPY